MSNNSDHYPFYLAGIPVLNLFTGIHDDYHGVLDHADKLDYERMEKIAKLAHRVAVVIAESERTPTYWARSRWLGAAFAINGSGDGGRAVVAEVIANTPAAVAGLQRGDEIVAVGRRSWFSRERIAELVGDTSPGSNLVLTIERAHAGSKRVVIHRLIPGFLGVNVEPVSKGDIQRYALVAGTGFLVRRVSEGGPADVAGIARGDIVVALDGAPIGYRTLSAALARRPAGSTVKLQLVRSGRNIEVELVLGRR